MLELCCVILSIKAAGNLRPRISQQHLHLRSFVRRLCFALAAALLRKNGKILHDDRSYKSCHVFEQVTGVKCIESCFWRFTRARKAVSLPMLVKRLLMLTSIASTLRNTPYPRCFEREEVLLASHLRRTPFASRIVTGLTFAHENGDVRSQSKDYPTVWTKIGSSAAGFEQMRRQKGKVLVHMPYQRKSHRESREIWWSCCC